MPDPLTIGLSAAGLIANLIGQGAAAKKTKKAEGIISGQIADLTAWKDTEANRPFLESNIGRSVITKATDQYKDQLNQAESTGAITGASDEAMIAEKGKISKNLGTVYSDIARYGTARKDRIEDQYRSDLQKLLGQQTQLALGQAQSGANLAGSSADFIAGLAPLFSNKDTANLPSTAIA